LTQEKLLVNILFISKPEPKPRLSARLWPVTSPIELSPRGVCPIQLANGKVLVRIRSDTHPDGLGRHQCQPHCCMFAGLPVSSQTECLSVIVKSDMSSTQSLPKATTWYSVIAYFFHLPLFSTF